jgi:hypothetical protein
MNLKDNNHNEKKKKHKKLESYDGIRSSNLMILLVAILFPQMFNQIFL